MTGETLNVLSLCTGIAGLELGVKLAVPTARVICYVERDRFCQDVLRARIRDGWLDDAPIWPDLRTFNGRRFAGCVDLVTAGYPCQPFSLAGQRRGAADERHLWPEVARIIRECAPALVFLENVSGHVSLGLRDVGDELSSMGYRLEIGLFSAAEVGASHRRERLFVLAHADRARPPSRVTSESDAQRAVASVGTSGCSVADAERNRLQGGRILRSTPELRRRLTNEGLLLFPPGPADADAWRAVLHNDGDLAPAIATEPAVRGMADGTAKRVDRLKACGNAVVPLQAAYAFSVLARRLDRQE